MNPVSLSCAHPPLVSVIMPCLNAEKYVSRAINSVLTQTLEDFELIIVDNGSTDSTLQVIADIQDKRIRVLHQPVRGVSLARNTGVMASLGYYLAFLDADDTWDSRFLETMYTALRDHQDAILAYCGWQNLGLSDDKGKPFIPPDYEGPDKLERLLFNNRWPIHAALTRRADVLQIGGFDTRLFIAEDYLLWLELSMRGRILRVADVLAYYHHDQEGHATSNWEMVASQLVTAKFIFLSRHPDLIRQLGTGTLHRLTWGVLNQTVKAHRHHTFLGHPMSLNPPGVRPSSPYQKLNHVLGRLYRFHS